MLYELAMRALSAAAHGVISPPVPGLDEDYSDASILLVEDNPRDQLRLQRMIEGQFRIEIIADGAEALGRARQKEYDSVVVSLGLQTPDGLRLCRSEERRVGKECGCTCRSRWSPYH